MHNEEENRWLVFSLGSEAQWDEKSNQGLQHSVSLNIFLLDQESPNSLAQLTKFQMVHQAPDIYYNEKKLINTMLTNSTMNNDNTEAWNSLIDNDHFWEHFRE